MKEKKDIIKKKDCEKYLIDSGNKVQSIWECDFVQLLSKNKDLQFIANKNTPMFHKKCRGSVTVKQILQSIKKE